MAQSRPGISRLAGAFVGAENQVDLSVGIVREAPLTSSILLQSIETVFPSIHGCMPKARCISACALTCRKFVSEQVQENNVSISEERPKALREQPFGHDRNGVF